MRERRIAAICLYALLFGPFMAGCDLLNSDDDHSRIQEDGVDGIAFGTPKLDVIEQLGPADGGGWADDFRFGRFWFSKRYVEGPHAGLTVYHIASSGDAVIDSLHPVDMFWMVAPYDGTTRAGIGIGSTRSEVQDAYGAPVDTLAAPRQDSEFWQALYCLGKRNLEFLYRADTVHGITLGYHWIPDDPDFSSCR